MFNCLMEEVIEKRMSRADFLKALGLLVGGGLLIFKDPLKIFKKENKEKRGYGIGPYGS